MLDTIIFDMDGVIIDTEPLSFETSKILLKMYDKDYTEDFHNACMGLSMIEVIRRTISNYDLEEDEDELLKRRNEIYIKIALEKSEPINGLFELLDYIKELNIKCAVATGSNREIAEILLKKLGIIDYFQFILPGDEMEKSKPDPWPYLEAMKRLGSSSEETIIMEDSINGIKSAIAAGCKIIAINSIWEDKSTKEIISFEKDLKGAKNVISTLIK
ncbi:HAD family hydrolase [Clostridium botulinum]|uniref:HAD family hydrolase n=1 Tax=Clostridium botulinum TaxID=1491 RepID=A0A6G4EEG9_CLOBO|nr:HAD family hydrolase [Clostridium botulinum]APH17527.1 HAD hydrolase, IA, variant 1 family protein [Clostridium botulinum]AUM92942.1 haloacid dehalogenase [Clostridium botulinum]NFB14512.1 HAD family hydrolase [Clostridium botulinum]NFH57520.1 HAD family hydrolase [Clostridium botulinum]NFH61564.1 HAD family hydrolase [Clostridium botulinum]